MSQGRPASWPPPRLHSGWIAKAPPLLEVQEAKPPGGFQGGALILSPAPIRGIPTAAINWRASKEAKIAGNDRRTDPARHRAPRTGLCGDQARHHRDEHLRPQARGAARRAPAFAGPRHEPHAGPRGAVGAGAGGVRPLGAAARPDRRAQVEARGGRDDHRLGGAREHGRAAGRAARDGCGIRRTARLGGRVPGGSVGADQRVPRAPTWNSTKRSSAWAGSN